MKKYFIILIAAISLVGCSHKEVFLVKNEGNPTSDSILLQRANSTIEIQIGEKITPTPLASEFIEEKDSQIYYVLLDENKLHYFNITDGHFVKSIEINNCGRLNNYSGFICRGDTTIIYNYIEKNVYMLDSAYQVIHKWNVLNNKELKDYIDPEALPDSPILYENQQIMLSGIKLGGLEKDKEAHISCVIHIDKNEINLAGNYPDQYLKYDFGNVYFNTIYHALGQQGEYVYSFPADHFVYFYTPDFKNVRKVYMGSRYSPVIESASYNTFDLIKDKNLRIQYYVSQNSYSNIIYDKYRKVYYRIAQHPLENWQSNQPFVKPFSIIVMDVNGKLITETPIQADFQSLNLHNMHVTKEGLLIQEDTMDENIIKFIKFELKR